MQESAVNKREQLISIPVVLLLGAVIVFLMTLLFPDKSTFEDQQYIENPDQLSIAYLKAIFKLRPNDIPLRLTLARQLVAIGKWKEAQKVVDGFEFFEVRNIAQSDIINIKIYQLQFEAMDENDPERYRVLAKAKKILKGIDLSIYDVFGLKSIAKTALSLNRPVFASKAYKRLAEIDKENKMMWWALAGKWARASSQPELASIYYSNAYHAAENLKNGFEYAGLSVISAMEASQYNLAIKYLDEYLTSYPENKYFLETAVSINSMLGNLEKETYWNKKLWLHHGQRNEKITLRQLDLELALGHLQHARKFSYRLVSIRPGNKKYRLRLAQLEEWTGHPVAAQKQWKILAKTSKVPYEDEQVLRLAIMNFDEQSTVDALNEISKNRKLTKEEMLEKVYSYERQGEPIFSQIALDEYLSENPDDKEKWFILAGLYENQNDYDGAVKTWGRIEQYFGDETQAAIRQVELHWDYQQHEKAYFKAISLDKDFTKIKSTYHVEILAELGWRFKDSELLRKSSKEVLVRDNKNDLAYERLLILADEDRDVDQAVILAEKAWKNTGNAIYLRMAIQTAIEENNRPHIEYLLGIALKNKNNINDLVDYVLVMAELEDKNENFISAAKYFEYAMRLSPDTKSTHIGLLWSLLNSNQRKKLKRYLIAFKSKAYRFSQYWPVYAAATHEIGESRESIYWHSKLMSQHPDDSLWLLSYADALESTGRSNSAFKTRLYVMKKVRENGVYTLLSGRTAQQLTKQYISLEKRIGLGENANNMIKAIINNTRENKKNVPYEFLVAWYLSLQNNDMARYWHLRQQLNRMKTSDNQLLTLALNSNDLKTIENLVVGHSDISPVERNEGLRRLGLYEEALANSIEGIGLLYRQEERRLYREQAASISSVLPNYWATQTNRNTSGDLVVTKLDAQFKISIHNWILGISASNTTLDIDDTIVDLEGNNIEKETDIKVMRRGRRSNLYAEVKSNQREDKNILPIKFGMDHLLSKRIRLEFAWENNQLSEESGALRSLGKQDKLHLAINSNLTAREYINARFFKTNYESRWGESLAEGWSTDFNFGHRLSTGRNEWTVQLDANWLSNNLVNTLPSEVAQRLPAGATTSFLIADEFGSLGISTRLSRGQIKSNYPQVGSMRYFIDAWVGQSFPVNDLAYRINAGFGTRILGSDELSLGLFADETKNKIEDQNSWGINLLYRNYLGR
jgi:polysaccharide biosynthesis protein PelB